MLKMASHGPAPRRSSTSVSSPMPEVPAWLRASASLQKPCFIEAMLYHNVLVNFIQLEPRNSIGLVADRQASTKVLAPSMRIVRSGRCRCCMRHEQAGFPRTEPQAAPPKL